MLARLIVCLFALTATLAPVAAQTQATAPQPTEARLDAARGTLDNIDATLKRDNLNDQALQGLRTQIEPVAMALQAAIDQLQPRYDAVKTRLDQLGPKPAAGAPPEDASITAERADQDRIFQDVDAQLRRARVMMVQAEQLGATINARRHDLFTRALFQRGPSILAPSLWLDVLKELPRDISAARFIFGDYADVIWGRLQGWRLPAFLALCALIAAVYYPLLRLSRRVIRRDPDITEPTKAMKARGAVWVALVLASLPILAAMALAFLADAFSLTVPRLAPIGEALLNGVLRIAITYGIARGLLSPVSRAWRMPALEDETVEKLSRLAIGFAIVMTVAKVLTAVGDVIAAGLPASIAVQGASALTLALMMAFALRGIMGELPDDEDEACLGPRVVPQKDYFGPIRLATWAAITLIIGACLIGLIAFGVFITDQVAWITGVLCVSYMLAMLIGESLDAAFQPHARIGRQLTSSLGIRRESLDQIGILLAGALQLALMGITVLLVLAPWGLQSDDIFGTVRAAYFGFQVGGVTISLSAIVIGLALFLIGFLATRGLQRWLETRFLPRTQLDIGLRNSIKMSVGYIGFIIAVSLALSYLGLSFDKLAIVAGALSVGIGFGLQSIVNNFVSGLILLWERAIRVGDWIVVGEEQGYVRRISVRATEIETFDRATVIMPNSNLVTGVVKNWVRSDKVGRVKIALTVSHDADPDAVRDLLVTAAKNHERVMKIPAPVVLFTAVNESSLGFELIAFVDDVEKAGRVKSDLHFEIFRAMREQELKMPNQQRDIRLSGSEPIEVRLAPDLRAAIADGAKPLKAAL